MKKRGPTSADKDPNRRNDHDEEREVRIAEMIERARRHKAKAPAAKRGAKRGKSR